MEGISRNNPIQLYPDGAFWCALIGENLQEGIAGFGEDATGAVSALLDQSEVWELLPHVASPLTCPHCHHEWVGVYQRHIKKLECPNCNNFFEVAELPGQ